MQLAMSGIFPEITEKRTSAKNIVLTVRDFEILEFIMDMKFAGVEEVFEKFFKITLANESAKSSEWARKRLCQLEKANFLKSARSFSESTRYPNRWNLRSKPFRTLNFNFLNFPMP